jgi:hypothetical protein
VSSPHGDRIIEGYLVRLRTALGDLPGPRQQELVEDVRRHIAEARAGLAAETDADILNILDRIGEPGDIAAEAREPVGAPARKSASIGILEVGALVLTPFLWPIGVILLWVSSSWNTRDKLIGTLVPPGGYLGLVFLPSRALIPVGGGSGSVCTQSNDATGQPIGSVVCQHFGPAGPPGWVSLLAVLLVVLLLVLPLLTAIYLGVRLRRTQPRPTVPA